MTKAADVARKPAASKMKLIEGAAAIDKAIASIDTRGKKLDRDIWIAAVSAMAHHAKHGDVTLINRLVSAMPKGSRVNALREFISAHGKVAYNPETKEFVHDKNGNFDLEGAQARSWTEYKPEQEYQPFDAAKTIQQIKAKLKKASEHGDQNVPAGFAEAIAELESRFVARKEG